jgi:ARID/BRIGHT DNA binding domain
MEDCGSPINTAPAIYDEDIDLHKLFKVFSYLSSIIKFNMGIYFQVVEKLGGFNKVNAQNQWKLVTQKLNLMNATATTSTANLVKNLYKK